MIVNSYKNAAAFLQKTEAYWEQNEALRGDFNDYLFITTHTV